MLRIRQLYFIVFYLCQLFLLKLKGCTIAYLACCFAANCWNCTNCSRDSGSLRSRIQGGGPRVTHGSCGRWVRRGCTSVVYWNRIFIGIWCCRNRPDVWHSSLKTKIYFFWIIFNFTFLQRKCLIWFFSYEMLMQIT